MPPTIAVDERNNDLIAIGSPGARLPRMIAGPVLQTLLINVRNGIFGTERCAKILKCPLRIAAEPVQIFRYMQVSVEKVHNIIFTLVTFPGNILHPDLVERFLPAFGTDKTVSGDRIFRMTAKMTGTSIFRMKETLIFIPRFGNGYFDILIHTGVPTGPDGE